MKLIFHPRAGALCAAVLVAGCASLDPTEDVDTASSLVEARSQNETGWTSPWNERSDRWDGATPLSAETAVRVALQNNRPIRGRVEAIVASRADYVQAHLLPNPIINFAYGFPTDGLGGTPLAVMLMQELTWLWRRPATIDAATAELRREVLAVSDDALRLVADVRSAHSEVVFAERSIALHRENLDLLQQSLEVMEDRFSVGEAARLDVNRIELDLLRAETQLADRESDLAEAKRTVLELLGRADEGADWRSDGVAALGLDTATALDEAHVIVLASTQRLDVAAADAALAARAADLELAELGKLPDVAAGVSYRQNFQTRPGVFPEFSVTPKIFDDNSARVAKAASEMKQAEIEADRVRQTAIAEARRAWVELLAQLDAVISYEQQIVALAEQNLELAAEAFDVGETDLTVLLEASASCGRRGTS